MLSRILGTKTFWGGLGLVGYGIALCVKGQMSEGVLAIGTGLQSIFLRDAVAKGY